MQHPRSEPTTNNDVRNLFAAREETMNVCTARATVRCIRSRLRQRVLLAAFKGLSSSMTSSLMSTSNSTQPLPDSSLVDARNAPSDFTHDTAVVYPNFISEEEGQILSEDILKRMKRRRYEKGHWDAVITNYKEVELPDENIEDQRILDILGRTRDHLQAFHVSYDLVSWLPAHAIDLKKEGELNAHVDPVKFSGDLVAGISLLSHAIMRLTPDDDPDNRGHVDLYLPPLSLYALTGAGRYHYAHELLPDQSTFVGLDEKQTIVAREHRLSIIFRDSKPPAEQ